MHRLLEIGASNAVTVAVLAVLVYGFSRLSWRPALVHGLWVLLLIKLLTPPVVELPMPAVGIFKPKAPAEEPSPAPSSSPKMQAAQETSSKSVPAVVSEPVKDTSADWQTIEAEAELAEVALVGSEETNEGRAAVKRPEPAEASASSIEFQRFWSALEAGWRRGLLAGWLAGSCSVLFLIVARIRRFRRLLRHAVPASEELEREVQRLGACLGLRKTPSLWMLPGQHSPMLWGFPRAKILFPQKLAEQLDQPSRETLLLHELAHYRRRDHWTRILEMLATIVYWWHPCLWWMRQEMRQAEEECCDGWVISRSPQYRPVYARALISVMDFLAEARPAVPPTATGIGNFRSATKRLTAIMVETPRQELNRWARFMLAAAAIPCLCLAPTLATDTPNQATQKPAEPAAEENTPAEKPAEEKLRWPQFAEAEKFEPAPISLDGPRERIRAMAYSADGTRLVASHGGQNSSGSLRVWDVEKKQSIGIYPAAKGFCGVHISPDGKLIAACGFQDGMIRLLETDTGNAVARIRSDDPHTRVRFSPDGKLLAAASMKGTLRVWDIEQVKKAPEPAETPWKELANLEFNLQCVEFLPDGKHIAAGGGPWWNQKFGFAAVWNIETGEQTAKMEGLPDAVLGMAVAPDGKQIATAGHDGRTRLWDARTGQSIKVLRRNGSPLEWVDYSPDGKLLATGSYDDTATVWNIETGGQIKVLEDHQGDVMSVRFAPDGKTLATGGQDQVIRLWDAGNWQLKDRLQMGLGPGQAPSIVMAVAASPDGKLIATAHSDRMVAIRDLAARRVLHLLKGHEDSISSVAFSPDGKLLATASYDNAVKLWNVAAGQEQRTLSGHSNWVMAVAFSPDGKTLASSGYDKTVRLWDVETGQEIRQLTGHTASVRAVAFSSDGKLLATGSSDHTAKIWNVKTGEEQLTLQGHTAAIRAVAFRPQADHLATGSEDATVRLWDLSTGKQAQELKGHRKMVWSLAFSPSGRMLVSGGMNGEIFVWDGETGAKRQELRRHSDIVSGLAFIPDGESLVSASYDMSTKQWMPAAAPLREISHRQTGTGPAASFVAFTPDGKRLITTNKQSGACRIWETGTGRLLREFSAQEGHIRSAALSADGRRLAVSQPRKSIRIWDIESAKRIHEFPMKSDVNALEFSPDGKRLISAGGHRRARIWDLETGTQIAETPQQSEELQGLACSPNGKYFVTCSGHWIKARRGEVKLWKTETGEELALLGNHRTRINAVRFTPDGSRLLAATNGGGLVLIIDMDKREKIADWRLDSPESILALTLNPEGTQVAIGRASGSVSLWDLKSKRKLLDYVGHTPNGKTNAALVWSLAFSPDGRLLASAGYDDERRSLHLWPTSKTEPITVAWQNIE